MWLSTHLFSPLSLICSTWSVCVRVWVCVAQRFAHTRNFLCDENIVSKQDYTHPYTKIQWTHTFIYTTHTHTHKLIGSTSILATLMLFKLSDGRSRQPSICSFAILTRSHRCANIRVKETRSPTPNHLLPNIPTKELIAYMGLQLKFPVKSPPNTRKLIDATFPLTCTDRLVCNAVYSGQLQRTIVCCFAYLLIYSKSLSELWRARARARLSIKSNINKYDHSNTRK